MTISTPSPLSMIAASAALSVICIIAIALRFLTRHLNKMPLMLDDWLTLPALLFTIGMNVTLIVGVRLKALGYPTPMSNASDSFSASNYPIRVTAQVEWAVQMMQVLQLGFVKLSFVFFFRRIFSTSSTTPFGITTLAMAILVILWTVAFFFSTLFACRGNFAAWWISVKLLRTKCFATIPFGGAFALSDFIMDFIIVVMPMPMILGLHMSTTRKLGVIAIFAFGALAVVASVVRLAIFIQSKAVVFKGDVDNDLLITRTLFWSMIESSLALVAACLPLIQGLFRLVSLESVIRSVRSLASLVSSSRGSRGSRGSRLSNIAVNRMENRNDSMTSHAQMVPDYPKPARVEAFAMKNLSKQSDKSNIAHNEILVNQTITQSRSEV